MYEPGYSVRGLRFEGELKDDDKRFRVSGFGFRGWLILMGTVACMIALGVLFASQGDDADPETRNSAPGGAADVDADAGGGL